METTTAMNTDRPDKATITLPTDREIVITRSFNAPVERVFEAHTKAELYQQWYGLRSAASTTCEIAARVGGRWRAAQTFREAGGEEGGEVAFSGEYLEVEPPSRLVYTERYEAMPEAPPTINTLTFEDIDGRTLLVSRTLCETAEIRDMILQSGMEGGVHEMYERLDEIFTAAA